MRILHLLLVVGGACAQYQRLNNLTHVIPAENIAMRRRTRSMVSRSQVPFVEDITSECTGGGDDPYTDTGGGYHPDTRFITVTRPKPDTGDEVSTTSTASPRSNPQSETYKSTTAGSIVSSGTTPSSTAATSATTVTTTTTPTTTTTTESTTTEDVHEYPEVLKCVSDFQDLVSIDYQGYCAPLCTTYFVRPPCNERPMELAICIGEIVPMCAAPKNTPPPDGNPIGMCKYQMRINVPKRFWDYCLEFCDDVPTDMPECLETDDIAGCIGDEVPSCAPSVDPPDERIPICEKAMIGHVVKYYEWYCQEQCTAQAHRQCAGERNLFDCVTEFVPQCVALNN